MKQLLLLFIACICAGTSTAQTRELQPGSVADRMWVERGQWRNGWNVNCHPSVNATEFATQYAKNKALWDKLFSHIASLDLDTVSPGKTVLEEGRLWVIIQEYTPRDSAHMNVEQHHNMIDLQYTMRGNELMGYANDVTPKNLYNPKKDVQHWHAGSVTYYPAKADAFYLFFPTDYHQPSVQAPGEVKQSRKLVAKIEYKQ